MCNASKRRDGFRPAISYRKERFEIEDYIGIRGVLKGLISALNRCV
jgi:hypothetical protein